MKKLLIILIVSGASLAATAQHGYSGRRGHSRPQVVVRVSRPAYPYYAYNDPFYTPFYNSPGYYPRETRLERRIEDIRLDYQDRIWSARHDNSLGRSERKQTIHRLKHERDLAINDAKRNYYKTH